MSLLLPSAVFWVEKTNFKRLKEAVSRKIVLEEQEPDVVDMMLRFIYAKGKPELSYFLNDPNPTDYGDRYQHRKVSQWQRYTSTVCQGLPTGRLFSASRAEGQSHDRAP